MPRVASTDHRIPGSAELYREQHKLAQGEAVDAPLLRPQIRVTPTALAIGAQVVADAVLIGDRPARIDAVYSWLKTDREHWLMIRPGQHFTGRAQLDLDPGMDATAAFNVLGSVLAAGFDADVTSGERTFATNNPASPQGVDVAWLEPASADGYELRFGGRLGCKLPMGARAVTDAAAAGGAVSQGCESVPEPCFDVLFVRPRQGATIAQVSDLVVAALGALPKRQPPPAVVAEGGQPWQLASCDGWPPESQGAGAAPAVAAAGAGDGGAEAPATSGPVLRVLPEASTVGTLSARVVRETVERGGDELRRCYARGLEGNPDLQGRLSARLIAQRDGRVVGITTFGDLPDQRVQSCIALALAHLRFPPSAKEVTKIYLPLQLAPR